MARKKKNTLEEKTAILSKMLNSIKGSEKRHSLVVLFPKGKKPLFILYRNIHIYYIYLFIAFIFLDFILIIFEHYMSIILAGQDLNVLSPAPPCCLSILIKTI